MRLPVLRSLLSSVALAEDDDEAGCGKNGLGLAWVNFSASQGEDLRMGGGRGKQKKVERVKG